MADHWIAAPKNSACYVLADVHIPPALCRLAPDENGWCTADLHIADGRIVAVKKAGALNDPAACRIDAQHGVVLSGLVDCHTHLDKAHVTAFAKFPATDLAGAIHAMAENKKTWTPDSMARRVRFSLATAYAYGVRALRSHVDFSPDTPAFCWEVMESAVAEWAGKVDLQLVPLADVSHFADPDFCRAIYAVAKKTGRIGMFLFDQPDLYTKLLPVFEHASAQGWDLDLHVDEGLHADLDGLSAVARLVMATKFGGTVLCGHCVALNVYDDDRRGRVMAQARAAGLHFVSLPVTNLYLQGRQANGMPQQRGMAPVAALAAAGATVSLGADNVRDGFCAFGDFDPMAVLNLGAQVGHLDAPARDWANLVTTNPATTMGLDWDGMITPGAPADLVLFAGRDSGEISARTSPRRVVIRNGAWVDAKVPDFRQLNEFWGMT